MFCALTFRPRISAVYCASLVVVPLEREPLAVKTYSNKCPRFTRNACILVSHDPIQKLTGQRSVYRVLLSQVGRRCISRAYTDLHGCW